MIKPEEKKKIVLCGVYLTLENKDVVKNGK